MAFFKDYGLDTWALFAFMFVTLGIYLGFADGYSTHWLLNGAGQLLKLPIDLLFVPLFGTGSALLAILGVVLFAMWFDKLDDWFPGMIAVVIIGSIALAIGV